jgi:hypothetical protein
MEQALEVVDPLALEMPEETRSRLRLLTALSMMRPSGGVAVSSYLLPKLAAELVHPVHQMAAALTHEPRVR